MAEFLVIACGSIVFCLPHSMRSRLRLVYVYMALEIKQIHVLACDSSASDGCYPVARLGDLMFVKHQYKKRDVITALEF